jgi:hypothetical protein
MAPTVNIVRRPDLKCMNIFTFSAIVSSGRFHLVFDNTSVRFALRCAALGRSRDCGRYDRAIAQRDNCTASCERHPGTMVFMRIAARGAR